MTAQRGQDGPLSPDSVLHRAAEKSAPGTQHLGWRLDEPAESGLDGIRAVRDEIRQHVEQLLAALALDLTVTTT